MRQTLFKQWLFVVVVVTVVGLVSCGEQSDSAGNSTSNPPGNSSGDPNIPSVPTDPRIVLIHISSDGTYQIDGKELAAVEIAGEIANRATKVSGGASAMEIVITSDEDSQCACIQPLLNTASRAGVKQCAVRVDEETHRFKNPPIIPVGVPLDELVPPIVVALRASEDGTLKSIELGSNHYGTDPNRLIGFLIGFLGDDRGPGSIHDSASVEFRADDHLQFGEMAKMYQAVAKRRDPHGESHQLVKTIRPVPLLSDQIAEAAAARNNVDFSPVPQRPKN